MLENENHQLQTQKQKVCKFKSLKSCWQKTSPKFKILLSILTFSVVISTFLVLISPQTTKKIKTILPIPTGKPRPSADNFTKLALPQDKLPFFSLEPTTSIRFGILPKQEFKLTSKNPVDTEFIKTNLKTSSPVNIKKQSAREFTLASSEPLGINKVLKINLAVGGKTINNQTFKHDYNWAYQTQGKFRITSHIPGDKKKNVPLNTGIEIVFSQDDFQNPEPFLEIEPEIKFRLERHQETLAIVPLSPLLPKTVYTVTLTKGLNLNSRNDPIEENLVFSFQTEEKKKKEPSFNLAKTFHQTPTSEPLTIKVFTRNWQQDKKINAEVYQFPSETEFINSRQKTDELNFGWFRYFPENDPVSTQGLSLVTQVELEVQKREKIKFIRLPEPLPTGFYLINFLNDKTQNLQQAWVQSTNIAGYIAVGKKQTSIWANNIASKQPASQAEIQLIGTQNKWTTDEKGTALFDSPANLFEDTPHYFKITGQNQEKLILLVDELYRTPPGEPDSDDYWAYLYQEKRLYRADDKVYFWGVIKQRDTNQPPQKVTVNIEGLPEFSQTITPQPDGSFIGSFALPNIPDGWYSLQLKVNKLDITSSVFRVTDYTKPEMKIEITADKRSVFYEEKVNFNIIARFYDETPASNLPLNIHETNTGKKTKISTNRKGEASYTYQASSNSSYQLSHWEGITVTLGQAQKGTLEETKKVLVYTNRLMLQLDEEQNDNQATLKAIVNHVDLSKLNAGKSDQVKGKSAVNQNVQLELTKTWWEKEKDGTYYDFVEKTTRPKYKYTKRSETVDKKELTTNDQGEATYQFNMEKNKSYKTTVTVKDKNNKKTTKKNYFYYHQRQYTHQSRTKPELNLINEDSTFSLGEEVKLNILEGEEEYQDTDNNRFLFIIAQRGSQEIYIQDQPSLNFLFESNHIPNATVNAVIFTGRYYRPVSPYSSWYYYSSYFRGLTLNYQKKDSQLSLEIEKDKTKYQPGDQAQIKVKVKNSNNQPAQASVNLILVDEALEALGGIKAPSVLGSLYLNVSHKIYYNYYTHEPVLPDAGGGGGEMGGGGGGRDLFKDTPFFGQQQTNAQGETVFSFQMPDNVTSWRVYAQAVNQNLEAGQSKDSLITTLPFFVIARFPKRFLEKDQPLLTGSGYGLEINHQSRINYQTVFLQNEQEIKKQDQWGMAYKTVDFSFPKLPTGKYRLSVQGKTGNFEDKVSLPFQIIKTNFAMEYQESIILESGEAFNRLSSNNILTQYPIKLIVSDLGKDKYYQPLTSFCRQSSNRLEKNLAKKVANEILEQKFEDACYKKPENLSKFQTQKGGLSQVNWGGDNLETTVWAIHIDPQPFDQQKLADYLNSKYSASRAGSLQKTKAAWGLSNLGQPMITNLHFLANQSATCREKLYTGLALATAGDKERARELYYQVLSECGYTFDPYIRIQTVAENQKSAQKDFVKDTALALLLGTMLEPDYNQGLHAYLRDYQAEAGNLVLDLAKMAFIKEELSKNPPQFTQISYKSPIRNSTKDLGKNGNWTLELTLEEINNFQLHVDSGKAEVAARYYLGPAGLSDKQIKTDSRLSINRSYQKIKGEGKSFFPGDIIKIKLEFDLDEDKSPRGSYTITDLLPAGLVYLKEPSNYGLKANGWATAHEGSKVEFKIYNSHWWLMLHGKQIIYYARVNNPGTYIAEPVVFQSRLDPGVFTVTGQKKIEIKSLTSHEN